MNEQPLHSGPVLHGGNLAAARAAFPQAPEPWLDLSTGINPVPYPAGDIPAAAWARLPEEADVARLEQAARSAWTVPAGAEVVAAPGTQALIQLLPRLHPAKAASILGFGYQEHPRSWAMAGAAVTVAETAAALGGDVAVIVNPNNPDGRLLPATDMAATALRIRSGGGMLVADEAFMDLVPPGHSLIPHLPGTGAVVLRSFGKTYGLAGLRLGFAVAETALAARLRQMLGPWAVSGPAIAIGTQALGDAAWLARALEQRTTAAARMDALLADAGFESVGGTVLFRCVFHPQAAQWHRTLASAGILVRPFPDRPHWLRFGMPADETGWTRLRHAFATKRQEP